MQRCTWNKFFHSETCKKGKNGPIIINCAASWLFHSIQRMSENRIDFCIIVLVFYSKHHAAERWDLEFGSNTTEKFENSLKYFKTHWKIRKLTRRVGILVKAPNPSTDTSFDSWTLDHLSLLSQSLWGVKFVQTVLVLIGLLGAMLLVWIGWAEWLLMREHAMDVFTVHCSFTGRLLWVDWAEWLVTLFSLSFSFCSMLTEGLSWLS